MKPPVEFSAGGFFCSDAVGGCGPKNLQSPINSASRGVRQFNSIQTETGRKRAVNGDKKAWSRLNSACAVI